MLRDAAEASVQHNQGGSTDSVSTAAEKPGGQLESMGNKAPNKGIGARRLYYVSHCW